MRTMSPMKMYSQARPQGEELVLAHLGLVKRVALHLKARVPAYMELDELIQVGMMGLLEASRVFDASKGVDFENFARLVFRTRTGTYPGGNRRIHGQGLGRFPKGTRQGPSL